jgi:peptide/nickel transport system permease protein
MSSIAAPATRDSLLKAALRSPNFLIGAAITLVFVLAALISFVWTPYDYLLQNIPNKLKPPSAEHWLGTDHFGRDIFSMIMVGARTSIAVAFIAVTVAMVIGVPTAAPIPTASSATAIELRAPTMIIENVSRPK